MQRLIQVRKFGGSSLANQTLVKRACLLIKEALDENDGLSIIVVVSAQGNQTDELFSKTRMYFPEKGCETQKALFVSTGELQSASLFSMMMDSICVSSKVALVNNIPIETNGESLDSRIVSIGKDYLSQLIEKYRVVIVPGYQGINSSNEITVLGRGGSDTSAVAIAGSLELDECLIFSDVDGIYTADPRIISNAKHISSICYDEMKEMALSGAQVIHYRAVEIARRYNVKVKCLSAFKKGKETVVCKETSMEKHHITGIVHNLDEARVDIKGKSAKNTIISDIFKLLSNINIPVDMLSQISSGDGITISFTIPRSNIVQAKNLLEQEKDRIGFDEMNINLDVAKISVIGNGLRNNTQVATRILDVMRDEGMKIYMMSYSDLRISTVIPSDEFRRVLSRLHEVFFEEN
ncbi:MAG: aspartate kinase [Candidatus Muiribacterium halophilum]|uniref:Aspartokinase n=1 Tax=Muiribacterium halophilum TaxID=2053465 RepID=A0A2N5ZED1_MUIH1|nr:MAG: aspartate kinase [Candidatus Muirbacterium halophilum]